MFNKNKLLTEAEISSFCQQMNMILKAGLPIYYGISILRDDASDEATKELLQTIYISLEQGETLYDSLSPLQLFPPYMLHMIHIGERTGRLEEVLDSLIVYYDREDEIRDSIKHAVTYPLVMSVMMLAVIVVIITKVIPIFSDVYAQLGSTLTGSAKFLMDISNFLNQNLLIFILFLAIFSLFSFAFSKSTAGKRFWETKGIAPLLASGRFANCMYLALASGLNTEQGLDLAKELVHNSQMQKRIQECQDFLKNGENFSQALLQSGIFSKIYSSIIAIGYKTSAMDEVMLRISNSYEKEIDAKLRRFISILEPTLIIVLSFFIGLILLSFLLPLLGIMSSIG